MFFFPMFKVNTVWHLISLHPRSYSNKLLTSLCTDSTQEKPKTGKVLITWPVLFDCASIIKHIEESLILFPWIYYTLYQLKCQVTIKPTTKTIAFFKIEVVILGNNQLLLSIRRHYSANAHAQNYNTTGCRYFTILSFNIITQAEEMLILNLNMKTESKIYTWIIFWSELRKSQLSKENILTKSRHNRTTSLIICVTAKF